MVHAVRDDKRAGRKPPEPHSFILNDVTLEKLQLILAANPRGTLKLMDELVSLLDFGRYSAGNGAAERAFYLECYEGGAFTVHRVGRDSVHVPNAALTIFGGSQPDRLATFKGLDSDGLLQRFAVMLVAPASLQSARRRGTGQGPARPSDRSARWSDWPAIFCHAPGRRTDPTDRARGGRVRCHSRLRPRFPKIRPQAPRDACTPRADPTSA